MARASRHKRLYVIAPRGFLGKLRAVPRVKARIALRRTHDKDLAAAPLSEEAKHLRQHRRR